MKVLQAVERGNFYTSYEGCEIEEVEEDFLTCEEAVDLERLSGSCWKEDLPDEDGEDVYYMSTPIIIVDEVELNRLVNSAVDLYAKRKLGRITVPFPLDIGPNQNEHYSTDNKIKMKFMERLEKKGLKYTAGRVRSLQDVKKYGKAKVRNMNQARSQIIQHIEGLVRDKTGLVVDIDYPNQKEVQEHSVRFGRDMLKITIDELIARHEKVGGYLRHPLDEEEKTYVRTWWNEISAEVPKDEEDD